MERETIEAAEFIALMEGRSLEELDKQKEALLAEQRQTPEKRRLAASDDAAEGSPVEPSHDDDAGSQPVEVPPAEAPVELPPDAIENVDHHQHDEQNKHNEGE